jgi:hypothetical protein
MGMRILKGDGQEKMRCILLRGAIKEEMDAL